jgi:hypothetical protein
MDKFADDLRHFDRKAAREASAKALNRTAKGSALLAKKNVRASMTVRSPWTLRSIRSTQTPPSRKIDNQFVLVGSIQPYMAIQETGGQLKRAAAGRRLTTARGSREGNVAHPRRKVAKGRLATRNIRLSRRSRARGGSAGKRAKRQVEAARSKGQKFLYLNLGNDRAGIFQILKREIRMVHRIMDRPLAVKPRPWLGPAVDKSRRIAPAVYRLELEAAIRRSGMFR